MAQRRRAGVLCAVVLKWVFAAAGALAGALAGWQIYPTLPDILIQSNIWMILVAAFVFAGLAFGLFIGSALEAEARARQDDR